MSLPTLNISKYGTSFTLPKLALAKTTTNITDITPSTEHPEGGVEYAIIINSRIGGLSTVSLPFSSSGLSFYYQPPLTEELNPEDYDILTETEAWKGGVRVVYRPENIVGSYAAYATGKSGNEYKTGKVFHIYRPLLTDSNGGKSWAKLNITGNTLQIIVDSAWLSTAKYPVTIDPTFGFTGIGGTSGATSINYYGSVPAVLGAAGTVKSISCYCVYAAGGAKGRFAIYDDTAADGKPDDLKVGSDEGNVPVAADWVTINVADTVLAAATYFLTLQFSLNTCYIYYDAGGGQTYYVNHAYGAWFDPYGAATAWNTNKYSIYATYTATGGVKKGSSRLLTRVGLAAKTPTFQPKSLRLPQFNPLRYPKLNPLRI